MRIILFIFFPLFSFAQIPQINIGKSAGKDPVLLWGGGDKDFGEFHFIVGESPKDGVYFIINPVSYTHLTLPTNREV